MVATIPQKKVAFDLFFKPANNVEFVRYCGGHFENGDW
jgi:hypothetical protein